MLIKFDKKHTRNIHGSKYVQFLIWEEEHWDGYVLITIEFDQYSLGANARFALEFEPKVYSSYMNCTYEFYFGFDDDKKTIKDRVTQYIEIKKLKKYPKELTDCVLMIINEDMFFKMLWEELFKVDGI